MTTHDDASANNPQASRRSRRRFDQDFSRLVSPRLLRLIIALAPLVQLDVYDYREACAAVWRVARRHGAMQLSDTAQEDLDDWIGRELLARVDDALPAGLVTPERLTAITGED